MQDYCALTQQATHVLGWKELLYTVPRGLNEQGDGGWVKGTERLERSERTMRASDEEK